MHSGTRSKGLGGGGGGSGGNAETCSPREVAVAIGEPMKPRPAQPKAPWMNTRFSSTLMPMNSHDVTRSGSTEPWLCATGALTP